MSKVIATIQDSTIQDIGIANFYDGIEAHTASLVENEDDLFVTLMLFHTDETNRKYAQYWFPSEFRQQDKLNSSVKYLEKCRIYLDEAANKDFFVYKMKSLFDQGKLRLNSGPLQESPLKKYFIQKSTKNPKKRQVDTSFLMDDVDPDKLDIGHFIKAEELLLGALIQEFNPKASSLLPFPIFAFGELIGAAFFIYDQSQVRKGIKYRLSDNYRQLTFNFTKDYELSQLLNMLQTFGKHPVDLYERYRNLFATLDIHIEDGIVGQKLEKGLNSILIELGYPDFYGRFARILQRQIQVFQINRKSRIKSAIISIIVDSFAHNIGAHSLIALKWWFEIRFKIMDKSLKLLGNDGVRTQLNLAQSGALIPYDKLAEYGEENQFYSEMSRSESAFRDEDVSLIDIFHFMETGKLENLLSFFPANGHLPSDKNALTRIPVPVDHHLYPFFEFLRNKSAFWSGVSRDTVFSGRIRSWYQLIKKFSTNTLFLGTVANSEGVNKINIHIEILDENGRIIEGGEFSKINLEIIKKERYLATDESFDDQDKYKFIREGENYHNIRKALEKLDPLFLPGELIGQEALYTIWENTLRNVKHYGTVLEDIRRDGLNFCISIQEVPFIKPSGIPTQDNKLYKVGTWLHHPQQLYYNFSKERELEDEAVIDRQLHLFKSRIVTGEGKVRLGGSFQDKVCSAMLMNNTFESVEEWNPQLAKKHYFPYIYPASHAYLPIEERKAGFYQEEDLLHIVYNKKVRADAGQSTIIQGEQRRTRYLSQLNAYKKKIKQYPGYEGILKRFFHVWKGENCMMLDKKFDTEDDNYSRFRILSLKRGSIQDQDYFKKAVYELRNKGLIRIVEESPKMAALKNMQGSKAGDENGDPYYRLAYANWLGSWVPKRSQASHNIHGITINQPLGSSDFEPVGVAYIKREANNWQTFYHNREELTQKIRTGDLSKEMLHRFTAINLAHAAEYYDDEVSSQKFCRVRSHGSFINYIIGQQVQLGELATVDSQKVKVAKLLETLSTQITIFDNRVYDIIPMTYERGGIVYPGKFDYLQKHLNIKVFPERGGLFGPLRRPNFLAKTHFLIMHISFLERIWVEYWRDQGKEEEASKKTYNEGEVEAFFNQEIKAFFEEQMGVPMPENFLLVITSGRGRGDWVESVKHPQITFRPIETILNAFEDGLSLKDDYQIKHNLCNLLFGS